MDYISSECYNNYEIFQEEQKRFFLKSDPMCHISEMRNKGDYRTTRLQTRELSQSILMVRMFRHINTNDIDFQSSGTITYDGWATQKNHYTVKLNTVVWFG